MITTLLGKLNMEKLKNYFKDHLIVEKILYANVIILLMILSSCSQFLASERSYIDEMNRESEGYFVAGRDFPVTNGDTGEAFYSRDEVQARTPLNKRQLKKKKELNSIESELRQKLNNLSEEEAVVYSKAEKYLPSDSEKLYYLSMNGADRDTYIKTKIDEKNDDDILHKNSREFLRRRSVRTEEIFPGMTKDDVVNLWGKPTKVEVAGHPKFQNERWAFVEGDAVKYIFFESGVVNGWSVDI